MSRSPSPSDSSSLASSSPSPSSRSSTFTLSSTPPSSRSDHLTPQSSSSPNSSTRPSARPKWGPLLRAISLGTASTPAFPRGSFIDIEGTEASDTIYNFTLLWQPRKGGPFKSVEISIFVDPEPRKLYDRMVKECLMRRAWGMAEGEGWKEGWPWVAGNGEYGEDVCCKNVNPEGNEEILESGRTELGLKVAWLQTGRMGTVMVVLQSLAGMLVLPRYVEGVRMGVRKALA